MKKLAIIEAITTTLGASGALVLTTNDRQCAINTKIYVRRRD